MNRTVHRLLAIVAVLAMLWLGITGIGMQGIDLAAEASHQPMSDPTGLSIIEGMYGQPAFAVVQVSDFAAEPLPRDLDLDGAIGTVLQAHRAAHPGAVASAAAVASADTGATIDLIELRVVDHVPIGQVMAGGQLEAFDALRGTPVEARAPRMIPQGRRLPPSLRQRLKTLHRFWDRSDTPGVYFEVVVGVVLWTLLVTGLVMYFRLLSARRRTRRPQWFWLAGGTWRGLHRSVSIVAALFLVFMAFTGTWIGVESSWSALWGRGVAGAVRPAAPTLDAAEVPALAAKVIGAARAAHPAAVIKVFRLRAFGAMKQGVLVDDGQPPNQWVFDATSGAPASLTEPAYPRTNFPFGVQVHEDMKHLHSGAMFGIPTRLMNLLAGLSLVFLSLSGIVVYVDLWWKRRKSGRGRLLWVK
ncbi:MAG TPA: PepSY-associated TM helix domain-containing protein [Steroidobacteraceae bacterium]|nr:PepSY-associated TM helix domain-containing protein [Steroidobacteraceae bacterium]